MTVVAQQRLGQALLLIFLLGVLTLWLQAPARGLFREHQLGNIGFSSAGFGDSFGAFPELVKDHGGAQLVPIVAATPQRIAQYRNKAWLLAQDASSYTLQVAVFGDERRIGDLLFGRNDKDQFHYVVLPAETDEADGSSTGARFVLTYGQFASREQAEAIAQALDGLPAKRVRAWSSLQREAEAAFALQAAAQAAQQLSALQAAEAEAKPKVKIEDLMPHTSPPSASSAVPVPSVIQVSPQTRTAPSSIPVDTL